MRVAMVSEHASPLAAVGGVDAGGQNVHVAALATTIARRGVEVTVYTRRDDPRPAPRVQMGPGVEVHHLDAGPAQEIPKDALLPYMDAFADRLAESWRSEPPDVVHAHFWMSGYAALRAALPLGIPVVQTFHALGIVKRRYQGEKDTSPPGRVEIEKEILQRVDHVIATCTDEVFELIRLGAASPRVSVIPCGVDVRMFRPDGESEPRTPGRSRLACVGRLVERKGIGNVISALRLLPSTDLVIAGGPHPAALRRDADARRLAALATEAGVADRVALRGRVAREDLPPLLRGCDVLVSVPWYEPFGITPLEAMACGVPVVAAAVGGLIDTVVDGLTGVHVPPRDPERLASELAPLLAEVQRRAAYGRAGMQRARRLYNWDRIAGATLDVYARLTRTRRLWPSDAPDNRLALPPTAAEHLGSLADALPLVEDELERLRKLGERLAGCLLGGGRVLAAGTGGGAALAQHLTAELAGRYQSASGPLSAICLHGGGPSLTATANGAAVDRAFAGQVLAHGRPGDVLVALSTSGTGGNVLEAARVARRVGLETWAFTGPAPNPLAAVCDNVVAFPVRCPATGHELQMVALHVICAAADREAALRELARGKAAG